MKLSELWNNGWGHFLTINRHKWEVMKNCFRVGLYKQGLLHDLSKYSPTEFLTGIRYYQGSRSPNAAEKEALGYSVAWLHHKGRNRHHFEYWIDFSVRKEEGLQGMEMPLCYVMEMVMDRIAASKVYKKEAYTDASSWEYYAKTKDYIVIHPKTRAWLEKILKMLAREGEEKTFRYIRKVLRQEKSKARQKKNRAIQEMNKKRHENNKVKQERNKVGQEKSIAGKEECQDGKRAGVSE